MVFVMNANIRNQQAGSVRVLTGNANNQASADIDFSIVAFGDQ